MKRFFFFALVFALAIAYPYPSCPSVSRAVEFSCSAATPPNCGTGCRACTLKGSTEYAFCSVIRTTATIRNCVDAFDNGNTVTVFHSADKCPVLAVGAVDDKVPLTPASAACTDAVVATYKSVYNKDCAERFTTLDFSSTTSPNFEPLCKSPCMGLLLLGYSNTKAACPASVFPWPHFANSFKILCKKNASGAYCGDALSAFAKGPNARRYGLSASSTKAEITAALRTEIEGAHRFSARQTSVPAPDECAGYKLFLAIQAKAGCCMGEMLKMMFASSDTPWEEDSLMKSLTSCGVKTSLCVADKATYGSVLINLALKVSGTLDTAAKEKIKAGLANDLAAFWGIDASRITITLTDAKRLHALEQAVTATAEVAGTAAGAAELAAFKSTLDTKGASAVPTTQTNAALAGTTAGTTTVSSATATQISPGATPPPATAGASSLTLPAFALLLAAIAAI
jgi:hypothetical protein